MLVLKDDQIGHRPKCYVCVGGWPGTRVKKILRVVSLTGKAKGVGTLR